MFDIMFQTLDYYGVSLTAFLCLWLLVAVCSFYFGVFIGHQINKHYKRRAKIAALMTITDAPRVSYNPQIALPY
uniref:Copper transporter n=1 Tax=Steinernema glaseri TaxID=37863 RepID=A0A1I8AJ62_9BILA